MHEEEGGTITVIARGRERTEFGCWFLKANGARPNPQMEYEQLVRAECLADIFLAQRQPTAR